MNTDYALNTDYAPSPSAWVAKQVELIESSGGSQGTMMRNMPVIVITMRGAVSGKIRKVPVMRVEHDGKYAAVASKGGAPAHPSWYLNLAANPEVRVQVYDRTFAARARTATAEEKPGLWSLMASIWPDYVEYTKKTTRDIPVVVLEPVADTE